MNHPIDRIGIIFHPQIPQSKTLSAEIATWLNERHIDAWCGSTWNEAQIREQLPSLSLLLVLGGDGSMLRAARLTLGSNVPIVGLNLGRVGFLCEIRFDEWQNALTRLLDRAYWLEKRLMLSAELLRNGEVVDRYTALNEVVVGRGQQARVVYFQLWVNGYFVAEYTADSLIISTPTGSTAYALAAGGPVLPPQLQNFVVVPVASHLSLSQPLVLPEEADITIKIKMDHEAMLTADGQAGAPLLSGDRVHIQRHADACYFARVENEGYFYQRLMERLGFHLPEVDGL